MSHHHQNNKNEIRIILFSKWDYKRHGVACPHPHKNNSPLKATAINVSCRHHSSEQNRMYGLPGVTYALQASCSMETLCHSLHSPVQEFNIGPVHYSYWCLSKSCKTVLVQIKIQVRICYSFHFQHTPSAVLQDSWVNNAVSNNHTVCPDGAIV